MTRYDLLSPRPGKDGKTRWQKVGAMFPRDAGGLSLVFDALPLPDKEGQVRLLAAEPLERKENAGGHRPSGGNPADPMGLSDEIPFNPELR